MIWFREKWDTYILAIQDSDGFHIEFEVNKDLKQLREEIILVGGMFQYLDEHVCVMTINKRKIVCTDLKIIELPEDSSHLFCDLKAHSINFKNVDTSKVTDMSEMFSGCMVEQIDLSYFDTSNVKDMYAMFNACEATKIDLSSFNPSNVTNMSRMFCACKARNVDISRFDLSKVTDMYAMFSEKC